MNIKRENHMKLESEAKLFKYDNPMIIEKGIKIIPARLSMRDTRNIMLTKSMIPIGEPTP